MCARASVLGYMADLRLYPCFHQLSEEESSANTVQSDPYVQTDVRLNAHSSRKADTHFNDDLFL